MSLLKKSVTAGLAVLTLMGGVATTATPASAWYRGGWGAPVAAGVLGGLAAGAIIGSAVRPAYGYGYGYGYPARAYGPPCARVRRPVYDAYGSFAGYRLTRVCD